MPRKILIRDDFYPYHVINRTIDKKFYPLSPESIWHLYVDTLRIISWCFAAKIHAFVLMGNHYHMVLSTPENNLDDIMRYFQTEVSRRIVAITDARGFTFQTRYRWCLIRDRGNYINVLRYVFQNPIRAEIVERVVEYKYSSLHGQLGYSCLEIPIQNHDFLPINEFDGLIELENLVNESIQDKELELIRKGIRRFIYKHPVNLKR